MHGSPSSFVPSVMSEVFQFIFSSMSGCCGSFAAVAISYPHHRAAKKDQELSPRENVLYTVLNLILTAIATVFGFLATKFGPVAVVMPLAVGAALFSNMILQASLGLAQLSNTSVTGTMVLVTAVLMLPDLGPAPPKETIDPLVLLQAPGAIVFIMLCFLACSSSIAMLYLEKVHGNLQKLILFALIGGTGAVLNMSIQKMLMSNPPAMAAALLGGNYIILSVLCIESGVRANGLHDASLFVPISNATNLFVNGLAGLCIWHDYENLQHPWSYFLVYTLVGLGCYLVSSVDVISSLHVPRMQYLKRTCTGMGKKGALVRTASSHHFHAGKELLQRLDEDLPVGKDLSEDIENRMKYELDKHIISNQDAGRLVAKLLNEVDRGKRRRLVEEWVGEIRGTVAS